MNKQQHEEKKKNRDSAYIVALRIWNYFSPRVRDKELQLETLDEDTPQFINHNNKNEQPWVEVEHARTVGER